MTTFEALYNKGFSFPSPRRLQASWKNTHVCSMNEEEEEEEEKIVDFVKMVLI